MTTTVPVPLAANAYDVVIGNGLLADLSQSVRAAAPSRVVVITDAHIGPLHAEEVARELGARVITVPAGEDSKSIATLDRVYGELLAPRDLDRSAMIVALGGGVVGDLAGFAAATLLRGIRCVQVPTTLLAMVDSSVGGKTAVNHATGKNLIGAFHQPAGVFCDLRYLHTLPQREYVSGLAEVVKTAAIGDSGLLELLESDVIALLQGQPSALAPVVAACVRFKAGVVADDERETTGRRAILNFGHTVGHALETLLPGRWLHGEAVSIGMMSALRLSQRRAGLSDDDAHRVERLLRAFGLPESVPPEIETFELGATILGDKKRDGGGVRFVVLRGLGQPELLACAVDDALLRILMGYGDA